MVVVVAEVEPEVVRELEREDVARVAGENRLQVDDGLPELAAGPRIEGVEVAPLALRRAALGDGDRRPASRLFRAFAVSAGTQNSMKK